jgi:hypothetical protein
LTHPEFVAGHLWTHFIDSCYRPSEENSDAVMQALALAAALSEHESRNKLKLSPAYNKQTSKWKTGGSFPTSNRVIQKGWK